MGFFIKSERFCTQEKKDVKEQLPLHQQREEKIVLPAPFLRGACDSVSFRFFDYSSFVFFPEKKKSQITVPPGFPLPRFGLQNKIFPYLRSAFHDIIALQGG